MPTRPLQPKPSPLDSPHLIASFSRKTSHLKLRQAQRSIDPDDLLLARSQGEITHKARRPNGDLVVRYFYDGIIYIVNETKDEGITCYTMPPELLPVHISENEQKRHDEALSRIQNDTKSWSSNSVIVVDTSGSMRRCDVSGAKTRLGAVWVCLAVDFLAPRLESAEAGPTECAQCF